jgi:hypothetical protein
MDDGTAACPECGVDTPPGKRARGRCISCYHRHHRNGTLHLIPLVGRAPAPPPRTEKACTICRETRPMDHFPPNSQLRDGRGSQCKACRSERYYVKVLERNVDKQPTSGGFLTCSACRAEKPEESFAWLRHKAQRKTMCLACESDRVRQRRIENPERFRDIHLRSKYGISADDYDELLSAQGGCCAICGATESSKGKAMAVDHCHDTGRVRGILCGKCNSAIGLLGDDPNLLARGAEYLRGR